LCEGALVFALLRFNPFAGAATLAEKLIKIGAKYRILALKNSLPIRAVGRKNHETREQQFVRIMNNKSNGKSRIKVALFCVAMLSVVDCVCAQSIITVPSHGSSLNYQNAQATNQAHGFNDADWSGWWPYPDSGQTVSSIAVDKAHGLVYAGGNFFWMEGVLANYLAVWDGHTWKAMGTGMNGAVHALVSDKAGKLYACGNFTAAGGVAVSHIACWDGRNWSPLGSGLSGGVISALAVGTNGNVYAGGRFTTAGGNNVSGISVAVWNGQSWSALGSGELQSLPGREVTSLALDNKGLLYVGGAFTNVGSVSANYVASWNGSTWAALGSGLGSAPAALVTDPGGNLYAGGAFTNANGAPANYIAKWDGSSWAALGSGASSPVSALTIDKAGRIYAGESGNLNQTNVAIWNGSNWETTLTGLNGSVSALALDESDDVYVGGSFDAAGNAIVYNVALWNGNTWQALPHVNPDLLGVNSSVNALTFDHNGHLYVGGDFTIVGDLTMNYVAEWNGENWTALGTGLDGPAYTMAFDHANNLYVGGSFSQAGGVPANNVAKWDGHSWCALGSGVNGGITSLVIDSDDRVFVGGGFTIAGGQTANYVAMWDGATWSQVGGGLDNGVSALAIDASDNLYAGGFLPLLSYYFGAPFGNTHAAGLSGGSWYPLPDIGHISALAVDQAGNLYAGGNAVMARLTDTGWQTLGANLSGVIAPGYPPNVNTLICDPAGNLYAGGAFLSSGTLPLSCIAAWDGAEWSPLGSGVNSVVNSLALDSRGHLYVGGGFSYAGTNYVQNLAVANVAPRLGVERPAGTFLISGQSTLDFGTASVESSATQVLLLTNIFQTDLTVLGFSLIGTNAADFKIENIARPVFHNSRAVVRVGIKFVPKASGPRAATLQVENNGAFDDQFIIALTGTGQMFGSDNILNDRFVAGADLTESTLSNARQALQPISAIPMIDGIVNLNDGTSQIFFSGVPDERYVVQSSADLKSWSNVSTNTCGTNGTWALTVKMSGSLCFFRVSVP
jgi:hypothetical protein